MAVGSPRSDMTSKRSVLGKGSLSDPGIKDIQTGAGADALVLRPGLAAALEAATAQLPAGRSCSDVRTSTTFAVAAGPKW